MPFLTAGQPRTSTRPGAAPRRHAFRGARTLALIICTCALLLGALLSSGALPSSAAGPPYAPTLSGRVMRFTRRGYAPNHDALYSLVIAATLHDPRPAPLALPPTGLILSVDLESFQPKTVPPLPDLLNPQLPATGLGGVLQGSGALVSAAGRIVYQGPLLAQVFRDNTLHLHLELRRVGASAAEAPVELTGVLTLAKGVVQSGAGGLAATRAPLRRVLGGVARGPVSWQQVAQQMALPSPVLMGRSLASATPPSGLGASRSRLWYSLAVLLVLGGLLWRRPWQPRAPLAPR